MNERSEVSVPIPFIDDYHSSSERKFRFEKHNIDILCVAPFLVTSKMTRVRDANLLICSETRLARDALNRLGETTRTNPYWMHQIQEWVGNLALKSTQKLYMKVLLKNRSAGLKKTGKERRIESLLCYQFYFSGLFWKI